MARPITPQKETRVGKYYRFSAHTIAAVAKESKQSGDTKNEVVERCIQEHLAKHRNGKLKVT